MALRSGSLFPEVRMPGLRSFSALVLGCALVLAAQASADEYVVKLSPAAKEYGTATETLISSFGQAGLRPLRELRNLPGTVVVEMPPATAGVLSASGYQVERSPIRRLLSSVPWSLDRENQRTLPLDGDDSHPYSGKGVEVFIVDTDILRNACTGGKWTPIPIQSGHPFRLKVDSDSD
jgi:hypothetical protein